MNSERLVMFPNETNETGLSRRANQGLRALRTPMLSKFIDTAKLIFRLRIFVVLLLGLAAGSLAHSACNVSPEVKAHLAGKPATETYFAIGTWFGGQEQYGCAVEAFSSAARLDPTSANFQYMWGLSLYSEGHDADAAAPLRRAAHLDPSDVKPHLTLAATLDRQKRIAEAEAEWRAALAIDPDSAAALDSLSQDLVSQLDYASVIALLESPSNGRARTSLQSLNLGVAYGGTAQLDKAVAVLREGLNDDPDSLAIADELAVVLMLQGRDAEAFSTLDLALAKHPDDEPTQLLNLRIMVSSHSAKAAEFARKLLATYPNQWEVLYLNGVLESQDADFQAARSHMERSIALNPRYYQSHDELGNILAKLGELPAAKEQFEKAIALGDSEPEVQYDLAKVLQRLGDTAGAKEKLTIYQQLKTARSDKVQAAGKAEVGDQAMAAGDPDKAASLYREALETDPDEPLLSYKLSQALDKMKDVPGEKVALMRAIQLNPNLAEAQNQMGYLIVREGDLAQAEAYFRAAVQASPSYVVAWINLAATLASEGKWQEARQGLAHALEIDPNNADARKLMQALSDAHPGL
jgi:superkiller protein 3